jgi:hypothetical protein
MSGTEKTVYRIIDRQTGEPQGVYSRACHDEYDFGSVEQARSSNCHDIYQDKERYAIAKYRVVHELVDPDCDVEKGSGT